MAAASCDAVCLQEALTAAKACSTHGRKCDIEQCSVAAVASHQNGNMALGKLNVTVKWLRA